MDAADLFATDTMAELSARQGRTADAVAIFERLLEKTPDDPRAARWAERLAALRGVATPTGPVVVAPIVRVARAAPVVAVASASDSHTMPLTIHQTVRSGQIV